MVLLNCNNHNFGDTGCLREWWRVWQSGGLNLHSHPRHRHTHAHHM